MISKPVEEVDWLQHWSSVRNILVQGQDGQIIGKIDGHALGQVEAASGQPTFSDPSDTVDQKNIGVCIITRSTIRIKINSELGSRLKPNLVV